MHRAQRRTSLRRGLIKIRHKGKKGHRRLIIISIY